MISPAWYVKCDECLDPAPVSVEGPKQARQYAAAEGYVRKRVDGKLRDLCPRHAPTTEEG